MKGKLWVWTGLLVLALSLGVTQTAMASEGEPQKGRGDGVRGEVVAVTGHTLTVQTQRGEIDVVTNKNTTFRIPGVEDPSIGDLSPGDRIVALGWWSGQTFHARLVGALSVAARPMRVGGQVASVDGDDITVNTREGEVMIVRTDADTAFRIPGVEAPGIEDISPGDLIIATGRSNDDGSLQAAVVAIPREADLHRRLTGEVAAIEGDTLTLRTENGHEVVLFTDGETAFHIPGVENPTLADVSVGDRVGVEVQTREGAPYAATVAVFPDQPARLTGQVSSIEGSTLMVETLYGPVQVLTDASTLFRVPGVENPALSDIELNDAVVCGGQWEGETAFQALAVAVQRGSRGVGRAGGVRGRATAVGSTQLTVGTAQGPATVLVDDETVIQVPGVENPTLADIQVGDPIGARGTWSEDGILQAEAIAVLEGEGRDAATADRKLASFPAPSLKSR